MTHVGATLVCASCGVRCLQCVGPSGAYWKHAHRHDKTCGRPSKVIAQCEWIWRQREALREGRTRWLSA